MENKQCRHQSFIARAQAAYDMCGHQHVAAFNGGKLLQRQRSPTMQGPPQDPQEGRRTPLPDSGPPKTPGRTIFIVDSEWSLESSSISPKEGTHDPDGIRTLLQSVITFAIISTVSGQGFEETTVFGEEIHTLDDDVVEVYTANSIQYF